MSWFLSHIDSSHSGYRGFKINILNLGNSIFPCVYGRLRYTMLENEFNKLGLGGIVC